MSIAIRVILLPPPCLTELVEGGDPTSIPPNPPLNRPQLEYFANIFSNIFSNILSNIFQLSPRLKYSLTFFWYYWPWVCTWSPVFLAMATLSVIPSLWAPNITESFLRHIIVSIHEVEIFFVVLSKGGGYSLYEGNDTKNWRIFWYNIGFKFRWGFMMKVMRMVTMIKIFYFRWPLHPDLRISNYLLDFGSNALRPRLIPRGLKICRWMKTRTFVSCCWKDFKHLEDVMLQIWLKQSNLRISL